MEEFIRAVRVSTDGTSNEQSRRTASAYIESIKQHADGWVFCTDAFFRPDTTDDVRFVCLQIVCDNVDNNRLTVDKLHAILARIIQAQDDFLPSVSCSSFVKNKLAQLLMSVLQQCGSREWPAVIDALLTASSKNAAALDFLLRFLSAFSDMIDRNSDPRSAVAVYVTQVKDTLRLGSVQKLAQFWYAVITTFADAQPDLGNAALSTMKAFISWMDINLVANAQFLPLFFRLLVDPRFTAEAADCVVEIVKKGMDPTSKIDIVKQLRIPEVVVVFSTSRAAQSSLDRFARLVSTAATELAFAVDKLQGMTDCKPGQMMDISNEAQGIIDALFPTILSLFAHPQKDICTIALDFIQPYVTKFKAGAFRRQTRLDHLQAILPVVAKRVAYPEDYFNDHKIGPGGVVSEDDDDFAVLRKRISYVFRALIRLDPETVTQFVKAVLTEVCNNTISRPFSDVECALYMFHHLGEGTMTLDAPQGNGSSTNMSGSNKGIVAPPTTASGIAKNTQNNIQDAVQACVEKHLPQLLRLVIQSGVSQFPHPAVSLMFFDVLVRYVRLVPRDAECTRAALAAFLDQRGLRSPQIAVRRRVTNLFQKFIRATRALLVTYVADILAAVQPVIALTNEAQQLYTFEDQLCVYESLGYLIGQKPANFDALMQQFMQPLVGQLSEIMRARLYAQDTPDKPLCNTLVKQHLNAVTVFSKGFAMNNTSHCDPAVATAFAQILELALAALDVFSGDFNMWTHVATFLHRVIDVAGISACACIGPSIEKLYTHVERLAATGLKNLEQQQAFYKEFAELLSIEGQVCSRFKGNASGICDNAIASTVRLAVNVIAPALTQIISNGGGAASEEARELFDVCRQVLQCLNSIMRDCPAVIISLADPTNNIYLDALRLILLTLKSPDTTVQRNTARFFLNLAESICGGNNSQLPENLRSVVTEFLCTIVATEIVRSIAGRHLVATESGTHKFFEEAAKLLTQLAASVPVFRDYFTKQILPQFVADPALLSQFSMAITQSHQVMHQGLNFLTNI